MMNDIVECIGPTNSTEEATVFIAERIRPDRLGELFANSVIDRAQLRAGRKWQACSTGWWDFFHRDAERSLKLLNDLRRMDQIIGPVGASLFRDVLDKGCSVEMAAAMRKKGKKLGPKVWQRAFCACLTKLAAATAH